MVGLLSWKCDSCTQLNAGWATECGRCHAPRPAPKRPDPDQLEGDTRDRRPYQINYVIRRWTAHLCLAITFIAGLFVGFAIGVFLVL